MTFDNVTPVGVLFTLPCMVLLALFSKKKSIPWHADRQFFDCPDNGPCRYGALSDAIIHSAVVPGIALADPLVAFGSLMLIAWLFHHLPPCVVYPVPGKQ